jgi:uncharacterized repeat protein (TIGR02543 family)
MHSHHSNELGSCFTVLVLVFSMLGMPALPARAGALAAPEPLSNASLNETLTFEFSPTLAVSKTGTGGGLVTSSPAGITCGATCSASFNHNASVTVTAIASTGSTFTGWSGSGCSGTGTCTVTMDAARSVTANFTRNTYRIYLPLVIR